jgi:hypothetical protein
MCQKYDVDKDGCLDEARGQRGAGAGARAEGARGAGAGAGDAGCGPPRQRLAARGASARAQLLDLPANALNNLP